MVNKRIARYFEYIDSNCEYVLWFKLSKVLLNTDEDIYIGAVYLPPINSNYCQDRILDMFYDELETFSRSHKYVTLIGDFNARTGSLTDITIPDDEMLHQIGVSPESIYSMDTADQLKQFNLDTERVSLDDKTNEFGRNIVEFCKNSEMVILNG